jgi:hypothetical protein
VSDRYRHRRDYSEEYLEDYLDEYPEDYPREYRGARPRAGLALTVLGLLAVLTATMFVIRTGSPATVEESGTPRTVTATAGPDTPNPEAADVTVTVAPQAAMEIPVRVAAPAPQARVDLRRIVYTVAGNQRHDDRVTVVYADETGTLVTAENVTLPWTLALTPSVPVNYVTANSTGSQINCWITDAAGATVASSTDFRPSATCNR